MKFYQTIQSTALCLAIASFPLNVFAADASHTVVLDATGVKNLRIETIATEETDFEETVFALGRIESIPNKAGAVSSRISGRIVELGVSPGDTVVADQEVAKVESRQPGNPPPIISLKTPIGGLVMKSDARLGDPVEPDKALLEIVDLSEVYAISQVPEHEAGLMKPGTKAHIMVAALGGQMFEGELLRFGNSADRESGTLDAIFRLPNTSGLLRPGMRAEFSIVTSQRSNVLSVPRSALQGEATNRFVYVKDFDLENAFIKTPVQVGEMNDRFVEILGGLFPADEVVTRGAYSLAFAGGGSVSLKAALDAAHGHEHAADGSELKDAGKAGGAKDDHDHAEESGGGGMIWKISTGALLILLIASLIRRKQPTSIDEHEGESMKVKSNTEVSDHAQ